MTRSVAPMIHVPDVRAAVAWYAALGFATEESHGDGRDGLSFAIMSFGRSWVMFNQGGSASAARRREVDLYVYTDEVEAIFERVKDRLDVVEGLHDTEYGMREFIVRDLNGFWVTFGRDL